LVPASVRRAVESLSFEVLLGLLAAAALIVLLVLFIP
jgi:hypothetical protein